MKSRRQVSEAYLINLQTFTSCFVQIPRQDAKARFEKGNMVRFACASSPFLCLQVSHHPPVGVAHAENEHWLYDIVSAPTTKFLGNSVDIYPVGARFFPLRIPVARTYTCLLLSNTEAFLAAAIDLKESHELRSVEIL